MSGMQQTIDGSEVPHEQVVGCARDPDVKPLVYLAGPYTHSDPVENMHRAVQVAERVLDVCVPFVPHLTGLWHLVAPHPYDFWLELDLVYLERCDIVYRFLGWSPGAGVEVEHARRLGIPVVFSEPQLRAWCETRHG